VTKTALEAVLVYASHVVRSGSDELYVATYNNAMYWIYLLECADDQSWYIGYTTDLKKRLLAHKSGRGSRTTDRRKNWKMIYCEGYLSKEDAQGREGYLKSGAGRRFLKKQIKHYLEGG